MTFSQGCMDTGAIQPITACHYHALHVGQTPAPRWVGPAACSLAVHLLQRRNPLMTDKTATQRTLFKGGVVLTMDANLGDLPCGDVLVQGSRILAVGVDLSADGARVIDAAGTILMPCFVNPHQHAWLGLMRGLMPNVDKLDDYMQALPFALGRHYRPQDMHAATLLTSLSCLDAGITSVLDASHNTLTPEHSDAAIQAFEQAGLRTLHMVGKPVGMPVAHWPHDLERLSVGRAAKDENLVSVGLFAQVPDAEQWGWHASSACASSLNSWVGLVLRRCRTSKP